MSELHWEDTPIGEDCEIDYSDEGVYVICHNTRGYDIMKDYLNDMVESGDLSYKEKEGREFSVSPKSMSDLKEMIEADTGILM